MKIIQWLFTSVVFVGGVALCRAADASSPISLAGDWRFEIAGADSNGFARDLPGKIHLPGTMDDAGLGPKNTKPPTLEGPYRLYDYAGPAWYQRDIEVPADWRGRRITLFLERCRWVTTAWLDDRRLGTNDSLIAPHVYDFGTTVTPGRHRLTLCVDNTVKLNLGRFVSALFGGTWGNMNGIIGRIELASTPPVWLDDVQVYPHLATKSATVKVRIGNATGRAGEGMLIVGAKRVPVTWSAAGGETKAEVALDAAKPWDEFTPNLNELTVQLGEDTRTVRFGLREFGARGTQFTLNGRLVFLRGTLECSVFPLTGYPPTDVPAWRRVYRIMKSYGLNHIRFHSWCPPDAAFTAADWEGIMIQVEAPQANVPAGADPARDTFIEAEMKRIIDTYGNHPSFCTMTLGNEYGGDEALLTRWVGMLSERDPRHLYSSASSNRQRTANRQFTESTQGRGIHGPGTEYDLRAAVASDGRPTIGHEIGQWMFYPDFREIKKYTGVMAPRNFELIRDDLSQKHQLELAPQYVAASGALAIELYKEEIESLLRTPGYGGFSLLDLHDYPTQGTALVGPLDAFWDSKGFVTPERFRQFCGATVPLLRMPKRTYFVDEPFTATVDLAHYGPTDLPRVQADWTIKDAAGHEIGAGSLAATHATTGELTSLGAIRASLSRAAAPGKLTVTVALRGTSFVNQWNIWVYPHQPAPKPPTDVTVVREWTTAEKALAAGQTVVFFPPPLPPSFAGRFLPVFWSPVWFPTQKPNTMGLLCDPKHPLFARFPTEIHTDWQWYEPMQHSRLFVLDRAPAEYRPTVQVIDNFARNHRLGLIFETRVGSGRLLVCGIDLPGMPEEPAARQLLASIYSYAGSAAFAPKADLSADLLAALFVPKFSNPIQAMGGRIRADSQASGNEAENAIDGDPATLWHTAWSEDAPNFPHELVVQFPRAVRLTGITCLPRKDGRNGWIKDYAVYVSADNKDWGAPVAQGTFTRDGSAKTVDFGRTVEGKFLRLVALSSFDATKPYASLAELTTIAAP